jgi:hypothetical protein
VRKPKPELPRLVEQLRILLWFQLHLTLLGLLVLLIWLGTHRRAGLYHGADREFDDQLARGLLLLAGIAVVLPVCVKLLRPGWFWAYLFILAVEAAVIVVIVGAVTSGLAGTLLALLYAAVTGWILVDLFRREVRAYLLRGQVGTGPTPVGK